MCCVYCRYCQRPEQLELLLTDTTYKFDIINDSRGFPFENLITEKTHEQNKLLEIFFLQIICLSALSSDVMNERRSHLSSATQKFISGTTTTLTHVPCYLSLNDQGNLRNNSLENVLKEI